jgi:acetyl-CoA acetyltransferase
VNPSGGLESRGHPLAATGMAQIHELANQLRDRCGQRQVPSARIAVAENGGGFIHNEGAVVLVTILAR